MHFCVRIFECYLPRSISHFPEAEERGFCDFHHLVPVDAAGFVGGHVEVGVSACLVPHKGDSGLEEGNLVAAVVEVLASLELRVQRKRILRNVAIEPSGKDGVLGKRA